MITQSKLKSVEENLSSLSDVICISLPSTEIDATVDTFWKCYQSQRKRESSYHQWKSGPVSRIIGPSKEYVADYLGFWRKLKIAKQSLTKLKHDQRSG